MTDRLKSGTIAVIAGGIDVAYPPENEARQDDIAERGLLIAEMPPGTEPRARHFPYRNRIIAGMTAGTVVIEAAPQSGSLITARLAAEAGREVMAVPGLAARPARPGLQPADPRRRNADPDRGRRDRGDQRHERQGRQPVSAVRASSCPVAEPRPSRTFALRVEELLGPSPVPVDEIVRLSGAEPGAVQLVLLELDLAGRLDRHAGNKVSLHGRLTRPNPLTRQSRVRT